MTTTLTQERGSPATTGSLAIEACGLVKAFGTTRALDGLDLSVPSGGVYAMLGPNGAGKTTAIRIFATLTRPDAGTARVLARWSPVAALGSGAYVGFLGSAEEADVAAAYPRATYERLAAVKRRYDPGNLFGRNHNIRPAQA